MLDFLRLLAPHHGNALRPASALRHAAPYVSDGYVETLEFASETEPGSVSTSSLQDAGKQDASHFRPPSAPATARGEKDAAAHIARPRRAVLSVPSEGTDQASTPRAGHAIDEVVPLPIKLDAAPRHGAARSFAAARRVEAQPSPVTAPLSPATVVMFAPARDHHTTSPTIHVSIDRIEVRAPTARSTSTPAVTTRSAASPQSLSDYLHSRRKTKP